MESEAILISHLERSPGIIRQLCADLPREQWRWSPSPTTWSVHDVVCHLLDEERDDFRPRLRSTLNDPAAPWRPIDPEGWVIKRDYAARESMQTLEAFCSERTDSIAWLRSLTNPPWENRYQLDGRDISAGDLLISWAAHDLHHIRQLARLMLEYLEQHVPYSPDYAT